MSICQALGKGPPDFKTGPVFVDIQSRYDFFFVCWRTTLIFHGLAVVSSTSYLAWLSVQVVAGELQPANACKCWPPHVEAVSSGLRHEHDREPRCFSQLFLLIVLELRAVSLCSKCAWSQQEPGVRPFCHLSKFSCLWIWPSLKWMLPKNFQGKQWIFFFWAYSCGIQLKDI